MSHLSRRSERIICVWLSPASAAQPSNHSFQGNLPTVAWDFSAYDLDLTEPSLRNLASLFPSASHNFQQSDKRGLDGGHWGNYCCVVEGMSQQDRNVVALRSWLLRRDGMYIFPQGC